MERIRQLTKMNMDVGLASLLSGVGWCWGGCGEVPLLLGTQTPFVLTLELEARSATGPLVHATQETLYSGQGPVHMPGAKSWRPVGRSPLYYLHSPPPGSR